MPKLHKYRSRNACYVPTCIRGAVVTFQLTPDGERKLAAAGIAPGSRFHRAILLDLYLFQAEFESKWAALRKTHRPSQQSLLDGPSSNELSLGT